MHSHNLFFFLGLSFIVIHEMDAVRCREWRIFPGLSLLDDRWGFRIFMLAHVLLFYFIFEGVAGQGDNQKMMRQLDVFFIVHVGLHLLFLMHKKNEFKDGTSWLIIGGAGLFGLIDLLVKS